MRLVTLNYKLVKTLDPLHLEMSLQMALLDKRFHLASLTIAASYRGIRTRRELTNLLGERKRAILFLQKFVKKRQARLRHEKKQTAAALLIQRVSRGHLVAKHYIRERGDISIMATLKRFRDMKTEIGTQLSNLIRFYWKCYKRKKDKKKKKKKGKKGKKGGKKQGSFSKTMTLPTTPARANSLYSASSKGTASPNKPGAAGSAAKPGVAGKANGKSGNKDKVTA